ncbi:hypothetical protein Hanom_Chr09g00870341 [Helianthus anomalus]
MNKVWDTCPLVVQPNWIFGGKIVRNLMFSHGIRMATTIPALFDPDIYSLINLIF